MTDGRILKRSQEVRILISNILYDMLSRNIKVNIICLLSYPDHGKAADELPKRIKQDMI